MNEWKVLVIGNLPSDILTGGYEFQCDKVNVYGIKENLKWFVVNEVLFELCKERLVLYRKPEVEDSSKEGGGEHMQRKHRWYSVKRDDVTFTVSGDWEEYQPATKHEPEEGGCFYEYEIMVEELDTEKDWSEWLDEKFVASLLTEAEECLNAL